MVHEIITLPLRAGLDATRFGVRVTRRAAGLAFGITRRVIAGRAPAEPRADRAEPGEAFGFGLVVASGSSPTETTPPEAPAPPTATPEANVPTEPEIPPAHVSAGLQFVEAFAEPGAEEGAGAEVHIKEPWKGYAQLTADEVIARLDDASSEELAAVALYESSHRRRKTVVAGARRRLRTAAATGLPT